MLANQSTDISLSTLKLDSLWSRMRGVFAYTEYNIFLMLFSLILFYFILFFRSPTRRLWCVCNNMLFSVYILAVLVCAQTCCCRTIRRRGGEKVLRKQVFHWTWNLMLISYLLTGEHSSPTSHTNSQSRRIDDKALAQILKSGSRGGREFFHSLARFSPHSSFFSFSNFQHFILLKILVRCSRESEPNTITHTHSCWTIRINSNGNKITQKFPLGQSPRKL